MDLLKKLFLTFTLSIGGITVACIAGAQQKINPSEIKSIIINNFQGGLGVAIIQCITIVNENGQWNSYQTGIYQNRTSVAAMAEKNKVPLTHIFLNNIDSATFNHFLSGISSIKPELDWRIFGITAATLKSDLQLTNASENISMFNSMVNDQTIEQALKNTLNNLPFDSWSDCNMTIIKNNLDTLKLETASQNICMLPWSIDKQKTYDISISDFLAAAIGKKNVPNRYLLQRKNLQNAVWELLEHNYPAGPLHNYRWNYGFPENLKLFKSNFKDSAFSVDNTIGYGMLASYDMPQGVYLNARIDITNLSAIKRLIKYKDTIRSFMKGSNFVIGHYRGQPKVKFIFSYGWASNTRMVLDRVEYMVPSTSKVGPGKLTDLTIQTPDGTITWAMLPNHSMILLNIYSENNFTALVKTLPKQVTKSINVALFKNNEHFAIFNSAGKKI